jgi:hypothetical protein
MVFEQQKVEEEVLNWMAVAAAASFPLALIAIAAYCLAADED